MKVYLDVFFLVNFLINLLVFAILNILLKKKPVSIRSISAASIGAGFAVLVIICGIKTYVGIFLIMYTFVSAFMIRIAYGKTTIPGMLRYVAEYYITGVFVAGGIMYLKGLAGVSEISLTFLLVTAIVLLCLVQKIHSSVKQEVTKVGGIFPIRITYNGKSVTGTAFLDTGNHLYEPISQEPVSIIEYKLFCKMLSENERDDFNQAIHNMEPELFGKLLLRYIPFHSLGTDKDYILGVRVDDMEIQVEGKKIIHTGRTWLGICDGFLSSDNDYEMLLNSKIFSE